MQPRSGRSGDVRLSDPEALRALAHPARLTVVDELYQGVERTASELAALTGLTPSAMSYHLRALERWGIVERASARDDARERPWRAPGRSLSFVSDLSAPATAAKDVIVGAALQQLSEEFHAWSSVEEDESAAWRALPGLQRSVLSLTADEAEALSAELKEVVARYDVERTSEQAEDRRRLVYVLAIVPEARG